MKQTILNLYNNLILKKPLITVLMTLAITVFFASYTTNFKLDASADSLVLEHDQALKYYRSIKARYGSDDFLIITYTPLNNDLFSQTVLDDIRKLRDNLSRLDRAESITTILDVPLTQSPPVTLGELSDGIRTLETPDMDMSMARKEFLDSPLYYNLLISPDAKTTALQVNLKRDQKYHELLNKRNNLREKQLLAPLNIDEQQQLENISKEFKSYNHILQDQEKALIISIRSLMDQHRDKAKLYLGGVPMIVADSIAFIQHDLQTFGIGVILFIVIILAVSFKKPRWVILPMITCLLSGLIMIGLLGLLDWRVTVVSSNFISILLIITLSLVIHLIVRYRELHAADAQLNQFELVSETVRSKFLPSFYTAITTMVAFGSLLVSGIRPVIDFGWMMVIGIGIAFILTFTFFPAILLFFNPGKQPQLNDVTGAITGGIASFIKRFNWSTISLYILLVVTAVYGLTSLTVENRFIDYYKEHTEIYQGMELIDKELGGTTPLDIIIDAPASFFVKEESTTNDATTKKTTEEDEFDLLLEEDTELGITSTSYWFNYNKMRQIKAVHEYLESLKETGKVLSIYSSISMLEQLKNNQDLDDFFLSIIYKRVPDEIKDALIKPYMNKDGNQIRFSIRIFESDKSLQRDQFLKDIQQQLTHQLELDEDQVNLTGMVVLYNNMLQSLYTSQILTIGVVFLAILIMFIILFHSFWLALLSIIPNMIAAGTVLGLMGVLGIPLDIMTITIAAICIGIGVDDTIHYVHRYQEEFVKDHDYWATIKRCHTSIGRAMYYTTLTITLGFSILALSNFIPMIYFGVLTGFAMMIALLANLTLLPLLIAIFKPLKVKSA
ncbi:MAG: MMPL family transporter [Gammaproteobacteria bacterium]|nr:MMPL family transporter [Gammaproteobacteria bacterium]